MEERNLMVVLGGGPTQVLNATLAAVVDEARSTGGFKCVLGARGGAKGLAHGAVVDLGRLPAGDLALIRTSPGAALGSSRFKPSEEDMERMVEQLDRLRITDILFVGGNGTMHGANMLLRRCGKSGYEVRVIGLPKTVDNDIVATDRCPGYGSAARYAAQAARDLGMDVRSLPQPVSIFETMGRSVGWLAAASAIGKQDEPDAPHMICLPEVPFDMERFIATVDGLVRKSGWAVVVISEGLCYADGRPVYQKQDPVQADPLNRLLTGGVGQYLADEIAAQLRIRCRCEKPGLLGRSSSLHVSLQDREDAELVGRAGVHGLLDGRTGQMVSLLPLKAASQAECGFVALDEVAGIERRIPAKWISNGPIPLTAPFFDYLRPLTGELMPYHAPLPPALDFCGETDA